MTSPIVDDRLPLIQTSWCVVRQQEDCYLVYNTRTDELHLIPPLGFYVYQLCDGLHSAQDLERDLSALGRPTTPDAGHLRPFLEELFERGIIDVDGDA